MFDAGKNLMGVPPPGESPSGYISFPIVGIGASAGGLEAFTQFLEHLSTTTGMAYVFVQHLDPSSPSILPELLARMTKMPLHAAQDQMRVEPDHVYVIPPNTDLTLSQGTLHLIPRTQHHSQHLTIDRFFHSLAQDRTSQAIGVLLSGTAFDGTAGLEAIKKQGGMTFAQNASSAKYSQMPQHAIAAGCVDRILPPEAIARVLSTYNWHQSLPTAISLETQELTPSERQAFTRILLLLSNATEVDFLAYRPTTLQRRIVRRMAMMQIDQFSAYATYLDDHPAEVTALRQDLLIHVTSFFRDPAIFEALRNLVFPELVRQRFPEEPLRLWVAGCSTGEEVYSLAICLLEFLEEHELAPPIQFFATDIDTAALKQARAGIYGTKLLQGVSSVRLQRFFVPIDRRRERYQISKAIRERCIFAAHNVANDPPFSRLDLVSCRNVLMYLFPEAQENVLQTLHYALNPQGFLLLGASESVGASSPLFTRLEQHQQVFAKKSQGRSLPLRKAVPGGESIVGMRQEHLDRRAEAMTKTFDVQQATDRLLLTTYVPASVVIDAEMQILYVRGHISPYLEPAPGKATFHLLTWVREGLKLGLRAAIHTAQHADQPVRRDGLQVSGTTRMVQITVVPLKESSTTRCFLIIFEESPPLASHGGRRGKQTAEAGRIAALEQELATTQAEVQVILEEHDSANERLQAANEESQSSNEELRSLNEELETSQAELQASNEELRTANQELQTRNEQLRAAQDYAESIVETIREPLVVLSGDLRLQHANTAFYQFFRVTPPETEHRLLSELGNGQWDLPPLRKLLEEMLITSRSFHSFEVEHHFPVIGHKIMVLNGRRIVHEREGTRKHLILLAMEDITARRELERQKETFLGMVSHELKTPLTAVKGFIQLLQRRVRKAGDEQTADELGKVDMYLDTLAHLIDSLLDASALESGMLSIHPAPFVVDDLVRAIIEDLGYPASRLHLEETVQAQAYADQERTGQVVRNLLANALKYSAPTCPVRVKLSASEDVIMLSVQDHGKGIPQDQQARIFERFARLDQSKQVPGTGLGLYIATQIVTQQGGRIWVESTPGKGSTFFFTLPLARELASDTVQQARE